MYNHTDHLGNIRQNITKENGRLTVLREHNYYPFGLLHKGYNEEKEDLKYDKEQDFIFTVQAQAGRYKYKFQGQERQEDLDLGWDSFKYRNYDYAIGRFFNVDPLAEKFPYNGVYNFSENRVVDGVELEGLEFKSIKNKDDNTTTIQLTIQIYNEVDLSQKQLEKLKLEMTKRFNESFTGGEYKGELIINEVSKPEGDFLVILKETTSRKVLDKDGKPTNKKTYRGGKVKEIGNTQNNEIDLTVKVDGKLRDFSKTARSFGHEAGHAGGLRHPWDKKNTIQEINQNNPKVSEETIRNNLMNSSSRKSKAPSNSGTELLINQLRYIDKLIRSQQ